MTRQPVGRTHAEASAVAWRGGFVALPFISEWRMTQTTAVAAVSQQAIGDVTLMLLDNGADAETEAWASGYNHAEERTIYSRIPDRTVCAAWNDALQVAFRDLGSDVLVVNNDVKIHPLTYYYLRIIMDVTGALLVSAVNAPALGWPTSADVLEGVQSGAGRGGPDYSCFLISSECFANYPFDPQFTYCGDLDHHRRIMLAGEGRRIFSACVPYTHIGNGSQTLRRASPEKQAQINRTADEHRRLYAEKWGGGPNEEKWVGAYDGEGPEDDGIAVTTPELQRAVNESL